MGRKNVIKMTLNNLFYGTIPTNKIKRRKLDYEALGRRDDYFNKFYRKISPRIRGD